MRGASAQPERIYVQHKITEHGRQIWELLSSRAAVLYICGYALPAPRCQFCCACSFQLMLMHIAMCRNAKRMPDDVKDAIRNLAQEYGNMPLQEANDWLNDMEKNKRFQLETWS
jgi:NADPH-ferrihemoprotein reductase